MIGGDVLIKDVKMKKGIESSTGTLFHKSDDVRPRSFFQVFNMVLKSGLATDPFLVAPSFSVGIVQMAIFSVGIVLLNELSFLVFIESWIYGRAYSYYELWEELFGSRFRFLIMILILITYISFIFWLQHELCYNFIDFLTVLLGDENMPSILQNEMFILNIVSFVVVMPSMATKKLADFGHLAILSNVCVLVGIGCLLYYYLAVFLPNQEEGFKINAQLFSTDIIGSFSSIGSFNLALFFHPILAHLAQDMERPTKQRVMNITWIASIVSCIAHFVGGIFSYLMSADNDGICIFLDLENQKHNAVIIGKFACYVVTISSNIFYLHFAGHNLAAFVSPGAEFNQVSTFFSALVIILLATALYFIDEMATAITDILANIGCVMMVFILPSVFYLRQYRFSHKAYGILSVVLLVLGGSIGVGSIVAGIIEFINDFF